MYDVAILFTYYGQHREAAKAHHDFFVRDNPGVPVVPLVCESEPYIPGTVDVTDWYPGVWVTKAECGNKRDDWMWGHYDQLYWKYLRHPDRIEAERYCFFEWDTLSYGMSVREFYQDVWDSDLAGIRVVSHNTTPNWAWWSTDILKHVGTNRVRGIVPMSGVLLSHRTATLIAQTDPPPWLRKTFSEAYLANLAVLNGIEPRPIPSRQSIFGTYGDPIGFRGTPGIYHPHRAVTADTPDQNVMKEDVSRWQMAQHALALGVDPTSILNEPYHGPDPKLITYHPRVAHLRKLYEKKRP